jgi:hypothetical protein
MVALIFLFVNLVASLFKSKSRLEAENAALRHQLTVLQRKVRGRVQFTNSDHLFFIELYRWFSKISTKRPIRAVARITGQAGWGTSQFGFGRSRRAHSCASECGTRERPLIMSLSRSTRYEGELPRICFVFSRIEFSVRTGRPQRMIATRLCSRRTSSEAMNEIAK